MRPTSSVRREVLQPTNDHFFCYIWQCCDFLPMSLILHTHHPHFPLPFGNLSDYFPRNLCLNAHNGSRNWTQYFKCVHTSAQDTIFALNKSIIYFGGDGIIIGLIFNRYAFDATSSFSFVNLPSPCTRVLKFKRKYKISYLLYVKVILFAYQIETV